MECRQCGRENPPGSKFCDRCGSPLPDVQRGQTAAQNKSKWLFPAVALLLAAAALVIIVFRPGEGDRGEAASSGAETGSGEEAAADPS